MSTSPTRVVADDDVLLRGLAGLLTTVRASRSPASAAPSAIDLVRGSVDLAIVDIRMPPTYTSERLDAAASIRGEFPRPRSSCSAHVQVERATGFCRAASAVAIKKTRVTNVDGFIGTLERIVREARS
jgi:serine/threonine-protein kinase PknK